MAGKKTIRDGIVFDSIFEANIYNILKENNINILDTHKSFELFETFQYSDINGKLHKMRSISYTPDFIIDLNLDKPISIECKHGIITGEYMLRRKLFIYRYSNEYYFIQINTEKEMKDLIKKEYEEDK